ncbi:hypothetical protein [[Pantoea] beijingensis]|nr:MULTISPECIES: hypothetical protein [Erwiniaceae]
MRWFASGWKVMLRGAFKEKAAPDDAALARESPEGISPSYFELQTCL